MSEIEKPPILLGLLKLDRKMFPPEVLAFQWEGIKDELTVDAAIKEAFDRMPCDMQEEKEECRALVGTTFTLMEEVYRDLFPDPDNLLFYHNIDHAKWTFVHALRGYVGELKGGTRKFDKEELKLLIVVSSFHEVDDWWEREAGEGVKTQVKGKIANLLERNDISLIDFCRVLVLLDDFAYPSLSKAIKHYLLNDSRHPPYLACLMDSGTKIYLGDIKDQGVEDKVKSYEFIADLVRGADYCQCLDSAYLTRIGITYKDSLGRPMSKKLLLGVFVLACELYFYRRKGLEKLGWGNERGLFLPKIRTTADFYVRYFWRNSKNILRRLDAYYEIKNHPYRRQVKEFRKSVIRGVVFDLLGKLSLPSFKLRKAYA